MTFGSSQGTLGDSLWLTPLLRAFPGSTLKMFPSCRNVASLYEGLVSEVLFVDEPGVPPTVDMPTHVSQKMLVATGKPDSSIVPYIELRFDEIDWARGFLSQYGDVYRAVVIHTHNSGWANPDNWFARHVKPPKPIMNVLAAQAQRMGYKVFQFCNEPWPGKPDNFDPLDIDGVHRVRGLTLRQTAACYHLIGRMVSGDTGDPYLMLAAGGRLIMLLCPEIKWTGYRHHNVVYTEALWKGEKPRTCYHGFAEWKKAMNDLTFDW